MGTLAPHNVGVIAVQEPHQADVGGLRPGNKLIDVHGSRSSGIVPGVPTLPSVNDLRARVRGWLQREPKVVTPRSILIVDGNAPNRESTARLVESMGYQALRTPGIGDAMTRLEDPDLDPEFVLLGFDLQDASGLEALAQIRALDPDLPV